MRADLDAGAVFQIEGYDAEGLKPRSKTSAGVECSRTSLNRCLVFLQLIGRNRILEDFCSRVGPHDGGSKESLLTHLSNRPLPGWRGGRQSLNTWDS